MNAKDIRLIAKTIRRFKPKSATAPWWDHDNFASLANTFATVLDNELPKFDKAAFLQAVHQEGNE